MYSMFVQRRLSCACDALKRKDTDECAPPFQDRVAKLFQIRSEERHRRNGLRVV